MHARRSPATVCIEVTDMLHSVSPKLAVIVPPAVLEARIQLVPSCGCKDPLCDASPAAGIRILKLTTNA